MDRLFTVRKITAALFILVILSFSAESLYYSYAALQGAIVSIWENEKIPLDVKSDILEIRINETFYRRNVFMEGYGYIQALLDKNEMNNFEIVKDTTGKLHYSYFQTKDIEVEEIGNETLYLQEIANASGSELFYLMPPSKVIEGYTTFDTGIPFPNENEAASNYLAYLGQKGIDYVDLRESLDESGILLEDMFYITDYNWTTDTAFLAFTKVVEYLEQEYELVLDPDGFYTDINHYNQILYENNYLGSLGRNTGVAYSGIDDFHLIYPKFATEYSFYSEHGEEVFALDHGEFVGTLLQVDSFNSSKSLLELELDQYSAYLWGNRGFVHVENHKNETGPKILWIKDSYMTPVAAFLSTVCSEVDLIDPRWFEDSIAQFVAEHDYDVVIVGFSPSNLIEEFFDFQ